MVKVLNKGYWDKRYQEELTGWDMGEVSPPLKAYFDQLANHSARILIPGCGKGWEVQYLYEQGFHNVHALDYSPLALADLKKRIPGIDSSQLIEGEFFELGENYDLIIEQTFFCALPPEKRSDYYKKMVQLLSPGGKLVGVMFGIEFEKEGPPFGGSKGEYMELIPDDFKICTMEECFNSHPARQGSELFVILEKRK